MAFNQYYVFISFSTLLKIIIIIITKLFYNLTLNE